jgi:hypothetical protein
MNNEQNSIDNLIETLRDGQEGFKQAAEGVKDPQLKSLFEEYSRQRARFPIRCLQWHKVRNVPRLQAAGARLQDHVSEFCFGRGNAGGPWLLAYNGWQLSP